MLGGIFIVFWEVYYNKHMEETKEKNKFVVFGFLPDSRRFRALVVNAPSMGARYIGTNGKYKFYQIVDNTNHVTYEVTEV